MTQLTNMVSNETKTMTTLQFAELTNTQHKDVLDKARKLLSDLGIKSAEISADLQRDAQAYESSYMDTQNRQQPMLILNKSLSMVLAGQYEPKIAYAVTVRWQELEAKQAQALPQTRIEAVRAYLHTLEELEASERLVASQMTSIQVLDRAVEDKKVITNESSQYLSVQRVKELNPTIKLSGRKLSRKSEELGLPPVPLFSNYGMNSPMTYHSKVWVTVYPTIRLP